MSSVLASLAAAYPLLYLNPDTDSLETYRSVVLRGEGPETRSLAHYHGHPADRLETADTPAGSAQVLTLGDRQDFELVVRGLMAAKEGPQAMVPESQGAAMIHVFNWQRIHTHLAAYPEEEQAAEFRRFISVKANYLDMLVVLSRGPYSHVSASSVGYSEEEWLGYSDTIRRYHELTHFICRRLYPDNVDTVRDELVPDAVGLAAAFGRFDPEMEKRFLGISDSRYTGGRLGNYTGMPALEAAPVCDALDRMVSLIGAARWAGPFDLIPVLMDRRNLPYQTVRPENAETAGKAPGSP